MPRPRVGLSRIVKFHSVFMQAQIRRLRQLKLAQWVEIYRTMNNRDKRFTIEDEPEPVPEELRLVRELNLGEFEVSDEARRPIRGGYNCKV